MAKKGSALGSTPTFNLGGSVANINGISVSPQIEPTKNKSKETIKIEEATEKVNNIIKQVEEATKKRPQNKIKKDIDIKEIKRLEKKASEEKPNLDNIIKQVETEKTKPIIKSNKKHLKAGYTRQTFAVKDEHLELIRALASYKGIEQKQLLEALLNKAFSEIDDQIKENALRYYKNDASEQEIDLF